MFRHGGGWNLSQVMLVFFLDMFQTIDFLCEQKSCQSVCDAENSSLNPARSKDLLFTLMPKGFQIANDFQTLEFDNGAGLTQ